MRCLGRCWARNARLREPWHFSETTQEGRSALPFVVSPGAQPRAPRTWARTRARERGGAHHCCVCVRGSDQLSAASQPALPARPSHALHGASGGGDRPAGLDADTPRVGIGPAPSQWRMAGLATRATVPGWCYGGRCTANALLAAGASSKHPCLPAWLARDLGASHGGPASSGRGPATSR